LAPDLGLTRRWIATGSDVPAYRALIEARLFTPLRQMGVPE